jgi:hypothetical protein
MTAAELAEHTARIAAYGVTTVPEVHNQNATLAWLLYTPPWAGGSDSARRSLRSGRCEPPPEVLNTNVGIPTTAVAEQFVY